MELDCADWMCFSRSAGTRKRAAFLVLGLLVAIQAGFVFRAAVLVPQSSKDAAGTFVSFDCIASVKGGKPSGSTRDCEHGEGPFCTKEEPCTPCSEGGCAACIADTPSAGNCFFTPEIGPYCRVGDKVEACTKCCA